MTPSPPHALTTEERATVDRAKERWNPESEVGELYVIVERLAALLVECEGALKDYIETIERLNPMASLNYGHSLLRKLRALKGKP